MRIQLVSNNTIYLERFSIFVTFLLVLTGEVEVHHFWLRGVISRTSISLKKEVFKLHNVLPHILPPRLSLGDKLVVNRFYYMTG